MALQSFSKHTSLRTLAQSGLLVFQRRVGRTDCTITESTFKMAEATAYYKIAKPQLWQLMLLMSALAACSSCCTSSGSLDCPLSGSSFGGRLMLMGRGQPHSAVFSQLVDRRSRIIFVMPPSHLGSHMGFGQGQIWIGSRTCQGSHLQPDHCPWTGDRPCLESGIPCETEPPSFEKSTPLAFSKVSEDSITVSWPEWDETTDHGKGPITGYKIQYGQIDGISQDIVLDIERFSHRFDNLTSDTIYQFRIVLVREGEPTEGPPSNIQTMTTLQCRGIEHVDLHVETKGFNTVGYSRLMVSWQLPHLTENCHISRQLITLHQIDSDNCISPQSEPDEYVLEKGSEGKIFRGLEPNSLYNITYLAENPARPFMTSHAVRTAETVPEGKPRGIQESVANGRKLKLSWRPPRCGERNGEITSYRVQVTINNVTKRPRNVPNLTYTIPRGLSDGDEWDFEVKACNSAGCGPKAKASGTYRN